MQPFSGNPRSARARLGRALAVQAALALLACGCTTLDQWVSNGFKVGPNYHEPPAPVAAQWIDAADPRVVAAPPDDAWWGVFNDPALNSLIESAYKQNLDLKTAATRVLQARRSATSRPATSCRKRRAPSAPTPTPSSARAAACSACRASPAVPPARP